MYVTGSMSMVMFFLQRGTGKRVSYLYKFLSTGTTQAMANSSSAILDGPFRDGHPEDEKTGKSICRQTGHE